MSIQKIAERMEAIAASAAQSWDNTGILIDSSTPETAEQKILLTIDFTPSVLEECIQNEIKYVISYHPVIFHPLKKLDNRLLIRCVQNHISLYSPHTRLDNLMNAFLLKLLGPDPGNFDSVVRKIKEISGLESFRAVRGTDGKKTYKNDGDIICGVGAAFRSVDMSDCMLITGEMSHHDLLKCKFNGVDVVMMEHSNSERIFLSELERLIGSDDELSGFKVRISEADRDPVEIV